MDDQAIVKKKHTLLSRLNAYDSLLVAYSGGVDSTFLLAAARRTIGKRVIAATANSPLHPKRELEAAAAAARYLDVRHIVFNSAEMNSAEFVANPPHRCYICKRHIFSEIMRIASELGVHHVAHGANLDDLNDYRPGFKAAEELEVLAPLIDAALCKNDIRRLSHQWNLSTWDKPSMACLASRIAYGQPITVEALRKIEQAETFILGMGAKNCRVRLHDRIARIELNPNDFSWILKDDVRLELTHKLLEIGFDYVTIDLHGYIQGSMNKKLSQPEER